MFNQKFAAEVGQSKLISVNENHERVQHLRARFTTALDDNVASGIDGARDAKAALIDGAYRKVELEIKGVLVDLVLSNCERPITITDVRGYKAVAKMTEARRKRGDLPSLEIDFLLTWTDDVLLTLGHNHEARVDLRVKTRALASDTVNDTMPPKAKATRRGGKKPKAAEGQETLPAA